MSHINFDRLDAERGKARSTFESAAPYPHLVIDDFLHAASYRDVLSQLPMPREGQKSSDYMFARNKFENPLFDQASRVLADLRAELVGERFREFLRNVYGKPVFVDEDFVGGGLHQGGKGSFLDMHADFSRHPVHREWVRELNILLYLNDGYAEEWGGHLDMRNAEDDRCSKIAPIGNRLVVMLTKAHTLHGYKPISFPEGRLRTSIAAYAYTSDADFEAVPDRSTLWRPEDSGITKRAASWIMPALVGVKRRLFGSSTAKRAERKRR
jgi:Rps23 Pro-64 3,4-dihydroxylase Tpa1-like proline 4-hydroxylase